MTEIYKDFLPPEHFRVIKRLFMSEIISWHFNPRAVSTAEHFMFTHSFMNDGQVINAGFFEPVRKMIPLIQEKRDFIGVSRIKANLYTNQREEIVHPTHYDIPQGSPEADKFFIAVYHVNTCNGKTVVDDQEIESVENQLIIFDNVPHYGTVQTDTDTRVVVNFNLRM